MKIFKIRAVAIMILLLLPLVLLVNGCGRDEAKRAGCPSGTYVANETDTITGPEDATVVFNSTFGNLGGGSPVYFTPQIFTVRDSSGSPRNNVCITFHTGSGSSARGKWYTDGTYSTEVTGVGPLNEILASTDDNGSVVIYWSTGDLPLANPVVINAASSPPTYTAGADQEGITWIRAMTGSLTVDFSLSWTVEGEPGPT